MRLLTLALLGSLAGCTEAALDTEAPSAPNQLRDDGKADDDGPLWAGLTSITLERWVADPCNDGRWALGDEPVTYDSWARERAAIRNVCFEVWRPGVTDWDNPDFWKQLDVRVHYRYGSTGELQWKHVSSIDRRGNNRRYALPLDYSLDPTVYQPSLATMKAPFEILSESPGWVRVAADLELYFTVNGRTLNAPSNRPFTIRYVNTLRAPELEPKAEGYVLHDLVTCEGARFGSGAGYFATDIREPAAIAALGGDDLIYGAYVARTPALISMIYSSQIPVAGESLPGFVDAGGMRITPAGDTMTVELDVYDRALGATRVLSHTFTDCVAP